VKRPDLLKHVILCALSMLAMACSTAPSRPATSLSSASQADSTIKIAVIPFGLAAGTSPPPYDVAEIIRTDLETRSDLTTIAVADLPARPTRLREVDFASWRNSEAKYLVVGLVAGAHDGGHEVEFRLLDPSKETTVVGYMMPSAPDALAVTAHQIADLILEKLNRRDTTDTPPLARVPSSTHAERSPTP
jgi:Tol biopolymer transport system component